MKRVTLERKCLAEQNIRNADVERLARLNAETEAWQRRNGIRPQPFNEAHQRMAQAHGEESRHAMGAVVYLLGIITLGAVAGALYLMWSGLLRWVLSDNVLHFALPALAIIVITAGLALEHRR